MWRRLRGNALSASKATLLHDHFFANVPSRASRSVTLTNAHRRFRQVMILGELISHITLVPDVFRVYKEVNSDITRLRECPQYQLDSQSEGWSRRVARCSAWHQDPPHHVSGLEISMVINIITPSLCWTGQEPFDTLCLCLGER